MDLKQLLYDQRKELDEHLKKEIVRRDALQHFQSLSNSNLIKVVMGVRRSGKSIFLLLMLKEKQFAYANFDDDRLIGVEPNNIIEAFHEMYDAKVKTIFFDEIQNVAHWELLLNRLQRAGWNIFVTGSNAKLLSKELATHLTGRHLKIEIFPFSFKEYLQSISFAGSIETTADRGFIKKYFQTYLQEGGFPEIVVCKEQPYPYLRTLVANIIDRDIMGRFEISYKKTFKQISQTLLSNPGASISYNRLKNQFNLKSDHTVKNYVSYLEETYLIFLLNRFSFKPVEIEKSDKKIYGIDPGIINSFNLKLPHNHGPLYENVVALELLRRASFSWTREIYYWKSIQQKEVDFVIKEGLKIKQLIQVCYDIDDIKTRKRETSALIEAGRVLKCKNLLIITQDDEREEKIKSYNIKYIPLWKWLIVEE